MSNNSRTRRRLLQTVGVAVGSSIAIGTVSADDDHGEATFSAALTAEEVTQEVETNASGQALFEADQRAETVDYQVHVDHICDVTEAHIHLGGPGEDGPVVAWLYPGDGAESALIEGRFDGVLAEGTLTIDDLVGPLEGEDLDTVVEILAEEGAYVNVHTEANPEGEIRGQIVPERLPDEAPAEEEPDDETGEEDETEEEPEEEDEETDESEEDEDDAVSSAADAQGLLAVTDMRVEGSDADEEWIEFTNTGDVTLEMGGWAVRDRYDHGVVDGRGFSPAAFPQGFILEPGQSVRLVTAPGENTDERVHWGYNQHVWNEEGDVIIVLDGEGETVLEHEYGTPPSSLRLLLSRVSSLFG